MKWTIIVAIICITGLEALAIARDIDGAVLGIAVAAIAGLGGYEVKIIREKRKGGK